MLPSGLYSTGRSPLGRSLSTVLIVSAYVLEQNKDIPNAHIKHNTTIVAIDL